MKATFTTLSVMLFVGMVSAESVLGHKYRQMKLAQINHHSNEVSNLIQLNDHENDTDDMPDGLDPVLMQTKQHISLRDHENDTDDMPDGLDPVLLQTNVQDHEKDTEDIPENLDPNELHIRDVDGGWKSPDQVIAQIKQKNDEKHQWDTLYEQEDDEKSYELVQFNHENDTDDIPDGQNPYNIGGNDNLVMI